MTFIATLFSALIATASSFIQVEDFAKQKSEAYKTMYSVAPDPTKLIFAGEMDELSKQIQAVFPVDKRTAVEALVLGDALFGFDPQTSYRLHKEAFEKNSKNEYIQFEWAMEQHRRGEYAAAIEGYQFYLRKDPQFAPALGLLAECLMRTGKIKEAVKAWEDSEAAPQGSLERLETYVYELHTPVPAEIVRAEIIKRVKKGDLDAAEELIAYDCAFPKDWWNINRATPLLKVDLEIIRSVNFTPSERLNQLIGIAEANSASEEKVDLNPLEKLGLITEEQSTLPLSNRLVPCFLSGLKSSRLAGLKPQILERAREAKDAKLFLTAARIDKADALAITKEAFEVACSEEIAELYCINLGVAQELSLTHPDFIKARSLYPENCYLEQLNVVLMREKGEPIQQALVKLIIAEYRHFSNQGLLPRPGAKPLRGFFKLLRAEIDKQK